MVEPLVMVPLIVHRPRSPNRVQRVTEINIAEMLCPKFAVQALKDKYKGEAPARSTSGIETPAKLLFGFPNASTMYDSPKLWCCSFINRRYLNEKIGQYDVCVLYFVRVDMV